MAKVHKVNSGETLWSISKHYFGQGHLWPSIYIYNNLPDIARQRGGRIINPNLIYAGDVVLLPPLGRHGVKPRIVAPPPVDETATRPVVQSFLPSNRAPMVPKFDNDNPAERIFAPDMPVRYVFPDQVLYTLSVPGFTVSAKLVGSVMLQSTREVPLVVYSNKGVDVFRQSQMNWAMSHLTSEGKISFDPSTGTVKFSNSMTTRAGVDLPATKVTFVATPDGRLIGRASIAMPTMKGYAGDYTFVAVDVSVDFEIEADSRVNRPPAMPEPAVATNPVSAPVARVQPPVATGGPPPMPPSSGGPHGLPAGTWLLAGAAVVVGVMVLQDFATAGVGITDNAAALGLAAALWKAGLDAGAERHHLEPGT